MDSSVGVTWWVNVWQIRVAIIYMVVAFLLFIRRSVFTYASPLLNFTSPRTSEKGVDVLTYGWLKNPDNIVYVDVNEFADNFGKETGVENLRKKLDEFRANPVAEGTIVKGIKRTALKMFIPNLLFPDKEKLEMGDTVFVYVGDLYPCYSVYWPMEEKN